MKEVFLSVWAASAFACLAQPALHIEPASEGRLRLVWPAAATGYGLEQAGSLAPGGLWHDTGSVPVPAGDSLSVTVVPADQAQFYRLHRVGPVRVTVTSSSPGRGESGVAVTRETVLRLSGPLAEATTVDGRQLHAVFGGRRLLTRPALSQDRRSLTLFYLENLPAEAEIAVEFDGVDLLDTAGEAIDPDGDGNPGGTYQLTFDTAGIAGLPGTAIEGHVFASERKPDGSNQPLANVTVTVDGAEEILRTTTDDTGFFRLQPAPAGRFFVHVDGRTATGSHWPGGAYYPFVGKAWETVAGRTNNLASGTGEIFLPLIPANTLQEVSPVTPTKIAFPPEVLAGNPALAGVEVTVPPNALFSENGSRGGKVGMAPVPPERLPEPLPPGLNLPLVITLQTDGPQNFDQPVPARFPNLPDPKTGVKLPPGAKTVLWSFNHDTGRWEAQGTATISADGNFAETDPGVGIRQPGWHGVGPGIPYAAPPRPPLPSECTGEDCPDCVQTVFCEFETKPGQHYLKCVLKCAGDVLDEIFGSKDDEVLKPRSPFETGLRCIGGPDACPQKPEDSLTPEQRDCMDKCRFPDVGRRVYVVPCEGFFNPCQERTLQQQQRGSPGPVAQAFADLLPDRFEEQLRFWEVEGEFLIRLTGTPKIVQNSLADVPKVTALFDAFAVRVRPESAGGIHLSPGERTELLALPRPGQFSAAEWAAVIDRLDSLQGVPTPPEVAAADANLTALVTELKRRGWHYRLDGLVHGFMRLSRVRAPQFGSAAFPVRPHYFLLKHHQSGFVQRGRLSSTGNFPNLVLSPSGFYTVLYLDPVTGRTGGALFQAGEVGSTTVIPTAPLEDPVEAEPDTDGDQLADLAEEILGTNPTRADSDGDGLGDGAELAAGSDPLDGAPQTPGTVAAADTPGSALDVAVWNDLAAVADANAGVALFDVANPLAPIRLAQLDTPGRAVAVAGSGSLLAVADDADGVAVIDVGNPAAPVLRAETRLPRQVRAVTILDGRVVAGLASGDLVVLDDTGTQLSVLTGAGIAIQDVLALNGYLYALKVGFLEVYTFDGINLSKAASQAVTGVVGAGGHRWRLGGSVNRLYATQATGFHSYDLSAPLSPVKLRAITTAQFGWRQIVPDGAGLGLAAVSANSTDDGPQDVSLYSLGADGAGTNFVATLVTPGQAQALAFHRGVALVADGLTGLSVVNYRSRETGAIPPVVEVSLRPRSGSQTLEDGAAFTAVARATDNERVSHVEFYLDGQKVAVAGSTPFEAFLRAPALAAGQTQFTLQARAFDTAGNSSWSAPLAIDPSRDSASPRALAVRPGDTERFALGQAVPISVRFDEAMADATLAAAFQLVNLGPDNTAGTADDTVVPSTVAATGPREYALTPVSLLPLGRYQARLGTQATDRAGNPLASAVSWNFAVQPIGTLTRATNLVWSTQLTTTNLWSFRHLPTLDDFLELPPTGNEAVVVRTSALAYDLRSRAPMTFDPSTSFRLGLGATFDAPVTIGRSASWRGGFVTFRNETRILGVFTQIDQSWTNESHLILSSGANLSFRNTPGVATTIRNAPDAQWEMTEAEVAVAPLATPPGPTAFLNEGRLVSHGPGRSTLDPTTFVNLGTVEVESGQLEIRTGDANTGPAQHLGSYQVASNATLTINGLADFGRASRVAGDGHVRLAADPITVRGAYETGGSNIIAGTVTFSGNVRTTGPWSNFGGSATFTGLSPLLAGTFVSEGALIASAQPRLEIGELRVYRDLTITTELQVDGPLHLDSTTSPSGSIASARLLGPGRLLATGPVVFAGIVNSDGPGILEIAGAASSRLGTILQFNATGFALAIAPGGSFDLNGVGRITPRGGLTNSGTLFKTDTNATEITRLLHNRGAIRLAAGSLNVRNGPFLQTAGALTLAGGRLTASPSAGSTADYSATFRGGVLEGAGALLASSVTNQARITPGLADQPVGILDLQIGTHPVFSIYQQTADGTLAIDVRGTDPGIGHDQLRVSGRAQLDGTLEVTPAPGFDPPVGQEFVILTCATRAGTFSRVTGPPLPGTKRFEVVYEATQVKLRVAGQ